MLKKFLHSFVRKRHPWRTIQFDELAEIYTSMSIRSLGFGIVGIFVPIYLYQNGVDLQSIFWLFAWIFLLRIPVAYAAAFVVGRIGPKHSIALSTLLFVLFLVMLLSFTTLDWPLLALAFSFTLSNGLFFIAYNTDFSKIKHSKHGGKELGWLYIFERFGSALGPLVGGVIASVLSPELTIVAAISILLGSLVPLFLTNEPVKTHQHIVFSGFPWRRHFRDMTSLAALNLENAASVIAWPLLVGVTVFADDAYVKLGGVIAASMVLSLFIARIIGTTIDASKGLNLLRFGVAINAVMHFARPFVAGSSVPAAVMSTANEPVTLLYRMPIVKGFYDAADSEEGYRIVYLSLMEMTAAVAKAAYFLSLYVLCEWFDPIKVVTWSFVGVALISLFILSQKFPALSKA